MYCVRSLRRIGICSDLIAMFYNATVPCVLLYNSAAFYGLLTQALKKDLNRPYKLCGKIADSSLIQCNELIYNKRGQSLAKNILKDSDHPLNGEYIMLPSGRRLRVPRMRTQQFNNTFVPRSIMLMNV